MSSAPRTRRYSRVELDAAVELRRRTSQIRPPADYTPLAQERVVLYIRRKSPECRIAWLYLLQNKIPHEIVEMDEASAEISHMLKAVNPSSSVPTLVDREHVAFQCPSVIIYLAERHTDFKGLGETNGQRARSISIMAWASTSLYRDIQVNFVEPRLSKDGKNEFLNLETNMELIQYARNEIRRHLITLEKHYLKKSKFLLGSDVSFVDYYVAMMLTPLDLVCFNFKPFPLVKQWLTSVKVRGGDVWNTVCDTHNMHVMQRGSRRASISY